MIKTKQPQVIDAQNGMSAEVYFSIIHEEKDYSMNTVTFVILSSILVVNDENETRLQGVKKNKAVFRLSTFNNLFGSLTLQEYEDTKDQLLINQIDYINKHDWTGNEPMPRNSYWNLTKDDLEIINT